MNKEVVEEYEVEADGVPARVQIVDTEEEYVLNYEVERPEIHTATEAILTDLRTDCKKG